MKDLEWMARYFSILSLYVLDMLNEKVNETYILLSKHYISQEIHISAISLGQISIGIHNKEFM